MLNTTNKLIYDKRGSKAKDEKPKESRIFRGVNQDVKRQMFSAAHSNSGHNMLQDLRGWDNSTWASDAANGFLSHSKM